MDMPEWIHRLFAGIDARDADAFASFLAEPVAFRYGSQPAVVGRAAVRLYVADFFAGLDGLSHELLGFWWGEPERVCFVRGDVTYRLADGRRVTLPFLNQIELSGAGITDYRVYADPTPLFVPAAG